NLAEYIKTMSESTIPDLISHSSQTGVSISLPQFSASSDLDLNDTLKKMGLGVAFGDKANFSNMGEDRSGLGLYISEVRQKSFLQVDEAGTKAGTATSVDMRKAEIASKILNFNRPFIYAVVDTQTRLPLYLGTMENPKQ
ncbi:MAG: serpin family protein, partial [Clostridia bacterium]|nr:serpin family protein [Clostridia bacterium]